MSASVASLDRIVAPDSIGSYTGDMPAKRNPGELGFKEAARFLGISEATFARLVNRGVVKKHKPPRGFGWPYYLEVELQALVAERTKQESKPEPDTE